MSAPVLPFSCWHSVSCIVNVYFDIMNVFVLLLHHHLWFVKIVLRAHACIWHTSNWGNWPFASLSSLSAAVLGWWFIWKIVEIVKHEVHIFLLFTLQMMYDSLVFMHLDTNVSICLSRNGSGFYEICLLQLIIHLILNRSLIKQLFLSSTYALICKVSVLFLKLIFRNIKSISTQAVISHPHLAKFVIVFRQRLFSFVLVVISPACSVVRIFFAEERSVGLFQTAISVLFAVYFIVGIHSVRIWAERNLGF